MNAVGRFIVLLGLWVPAVVFGLDGLHQIRSDLVSGGQPDQAALEAFAESGGTLVIDLRMPDEDRGLDEAEVVKALGLQYINLPVAGAEDITAENAAALHRVLAAARGPVLLHCKSGNRVGALLALDAVAHGQSREEALELARQAGMNRLEPVVRERLGCSAEAC